MQIGVRDLRLASNAADIQKANDYIATRLKSVDHFVDEMLKLSKSAENRARIEKLKTRASDYSKGAQQISAVRAEIVAAAGATDAAARIAKLNEEALRIAREVTLPIAAEIEPLPTSSPISPNTVWKSKPPRPPAKWPPRNGNPWLWVSARFCC